MKSRILIFSLLIAFYLSLFTLVFAQAPLPPPTYTLPPLPTGTGYTQAEIQSILIRFANFLIAAGIILGIIAIVVSGIMYFMAGSDIKAEKAKGWFRNGVIGAFIILAVGVIILTIYNIVVTRTFFGGSQVPVPIPIPPPLGGLGSPCQADNDCQVGLVCRPGISGDTCQNP